MGEPSTYADRRNQRTTIAGDAVLVLIAAVVSFRHMHELCLRHGEDHLAPVLIPLAVDGLIVVASMSILLANRYGPRDGLLAWSPLVVGGYELLMSRIRRVSAQRRPAPRARTGRTCPTRSAKNARAAVTRA
ncbi:DUF2637 domain-containing protein [Microbispora sp. NBC_01389]|uniref:DUF2637 domain-containing protein n=1 Tax=Microbispora sp. NBC_01389 TaxID=2903584 RepID=UPI0038645193